MVSQTLDRGVKLRLIWQIDAEDAWVNVLHGVTTPIAHAIADLPDIVMIAAKSAMVLSGLDDVMNNQTRLHRATARDLDQPNQAEYISTETPLGGTSSAGAIPLSAAICVTSRTALAGRSYRGRTYIAGFSETHNVSNGPSAAARTNAALFMTSLAAELLIEHVELGVASWTKDKVSTAVGTFQPTTQYVVTSPRWTSQRRRNVPGI